LPFFFPAQLILVVAGPEETMNLAGKVLRLIQIRLVTASLVKITRAGQDNSPQGRISPQYFIGVNNETLSVAAMCVSDPDCSSFTIQS
jgi:hypothetical protein